LLLQKINKELKLHFFIETKTQLSKLSSKNANILIVTSEALKKKGIKM